MTRTLRRVAIRFRTTAPAPAANAASGQTAPGHAGPPRPGDKRGHHCRRLQRQNRRDNRVNFQASFVFHGAQTLGANVLKRKRDGDDGRLNRWETIKDFRIAAEVIAQAGADRLVVLDPHTLSLEAMFAVPVEMLTAIPTLAAAVEATIDEGVVVVAPDFGALRLARHFASLVRAPFAVVNKHRVSRDHRRGRGVGRPRAGPSGGAGR